MKLPLRKLSLYKHGVGHFVHEGEISGREEILFSFRTQEMNDVLKSLVIIDESQQPVSVKYEPLIPLQKQNGNLTWTISSGGNILAFLNQIRGAKIKFQLSESSNQASVIEGQVIGTSLPPTSFKYNQENENENEVLLLVANDSVVKISLKTIVSFQILEDSLAEDIKFLLNNWLLEKKRDVKFLRIQTSGNAKRKIKVSYVIETPIWKASYRVVLPDLNNNNRTKSKEKNDISSSQCWIQGLALIDNGTDFNWSEVSLSLVSGVPISFIHDLYPMQFNIRPFVEYSGNFEKELKIFKENEQKSKATISGYRPSNWIQQHQNFHFPQQEQVVQQPSLNSNTISDTTSSGFGSSLFFRTDPSPPVKLSPQPSLAFEIGTQTIEIGDLFHYEISIPVTIEQGQSALVPFIQQNMEGGKISYFNSTRCGTRVFSALRLINTTNTTLEMGPITVLESDQYVGETLTEILRPKEEQILPYSVEFSCTVSLSTSETSQLPISVRIQNGTLHLDRTHQLFSSYNIKNESLENLDFILEHPNSEPTLKLINNDRWILTNKRFHRFRFSVDPSSTFNFKVVESRPHFTQFSLFSNLSRSSLKAWKNNELINETIFNRLSQILDKSESISQLGDQILDLKQSKADLLETLSQLRSNLQALQGPSSTYSETWAQQINITQEGLNSIQKQLKEKKKLLEEESKQLTEEITNIEYSNQINKDISIPTEFICLQFFVK